MAREVANIMVHCGWEPEPEKGDPAINVAVTPAVIVAHNGLIPQTDIFTDLYIGGEPADLQAIAPLMSSEAGKTDPDTGLHWSYLSKDGRIGYKVFSTGLKKDFTASSYILYDGKQYPFDIQFVNVADGAQGVPGRDRKLPRVREWSAVPVGDNLTTGLDETDDWTDIVYILDEEAPAGAWYWQCIQNFTKQNGQIPPANNSDTGNALYGYLRKTSNYAALATDLFFASFSMIKNLGVETIDMRDGNGNILFQAKDGVVTCNTGNFKDVNVSGQLTASSMAFRMSTASSGSIPNGALCFDISSIKLPELSEGSVRTIRILNPELTRSAPENLTLIPQTSNVRIVEGLRFDNAPSATLTLTEKGRNGRCYIEMLGYYSTLDSMTEWHICQLTNIE